MSGLWTVMNCKWKWVLTSWLCLLRNYITMIHGQQNIQYHLPCSWNKKWGQEITRFKNRNMTERGKIKRQYSGYVMLCKYIQNYISIFVNYAVTARPLMAGWQWIGSKRLSPNFMVLALYLRRTDKGHKKFTQDRQYLVVVRNGQQLHISHKLHCLKQPAQSQKL
jgi:hypothetical protein